MILSHKSHPQSRHNRHFVFFDLLAKVKAIAYFYLLHLRQKARQQNRRAAICIFLTNSAFFFQMIKHFRKNQPSCIQQ